MQATPADGEPAGCARPRRFLRFLTPDGRLLPVACGCGNKCDYCRFMATVLWATMVLTDARRSHPPTVGLTLTTVRAHTEPAVFRRDVQAVRKYLRAQLGRYEDLHHIEFTTGNGAHAGGVRRIHSHGLVKVPEPLTSGQLLELEQGVRSVWEPRTGAHRVEVAELRTASGAAHYLTHHHGKRAQLPPRGWVGRRYRPTRGYFDQPADARRSEAQAVLRDEALVRGVRALLNDDLAEQNVDLDPDLYDDVIGDHLDRARDLAAEGVELVRVQEVPTSFGDDDQPTAWELEVLGPADAA